ncbi:hypothetical protein Hdeb2414_s0002g00056441 [Helianthus debilis subsp. tardiflorus]
MATLDKLVISDPGDLQWIYDIDLIINNKFENEAEPSSISLFQVPETLTKKKPEAYEPQQIGLGPLHHFRPQPYKKMEQKKLDVLQKVTKNKETKEEVLVYVGKLVPMVRSCYDMFLQHNDGALALSFVIDGLFLRNLFNTYNYSRDHRSELPKVGPMERLVAQDLLMVENQIPFMVLEEIDKALYVCAPDDFDSSDYLSPSIFRTFCEIHSPLMLCPLSVAPSRVDYLLHYMYYSIINNVSIPKPVDQIPEDDQGGHGHHPVMISAYEDALTLVSKFPKKEFLQVYDKTISFLETVSQSKTPIIPSASKLHDKSGFQFHSLEEDQGIHNIHIRGRDIYLPRITLNKDSEVILRNLAAYETLAAKSDSFPLNEYIGMMCGLIMTKEDAKYLKTRNVILGDMGADEVAKLFIGISSSIPIVKSKEKSKLRKVIDEINKVYDSGVRMKTDLLLKKLARWFLVFLKAVGSFVESSWKIVAFLVSIVTVFLLTSQAYCDVYGCGDKTVTLLPYASS